MSYIRLSAGRCEACDKILDESEMKIKGWNSGVELGLCRKCASFVNNPNMHSSDDGCANYAACDEDDQPVYDESIVKLFD